MSQAADLFPETLGGRVAVRQFGSTLKCKYNYPLAVAELRPHWDEQAGYWVVGWFCHVSGASADEWNIGKDTRANWPWYRPNSRPSGKDLDVACAIAARALKIVLTQIKEYAQSDASTAANELIDQLEQSARKWLGAAE